MGRRSALAVGTFIFLALALATILAFRPRDELADLQRSARTVHTTYLEDQPFNGQNRVVRQRMLIFGHVPFESVANLLSKLKGWRRELYWDDPVMPDMPDTHAPLVLVKDSGPESFTSLELNDQDRSGVVLYEVHVLSPKETLYAKYFSFGRYPVDDMKIS